MAGIIKQAGGNTPFDVPGNGERLIKCSKAVINAGKYMAMYVNHVMIQGQSCYSVLLDFYKPWLVPADCLPEK